MNRKAITGEGTGKHFRKQQQKRDDISSRYYYASTMLMGNMQTGEIKTLCCWNATIPCNLPHTDFVAFVSGDEENGYEVPGFAKWENVVAVVGYRMQRADDTPARFLVSSYPDEVEMAQLLAKPGNPSPDNWGILPESMRAVEKRYAFYKARDGLRV